MLALRRTRSVRVSPYLSQMEKLGKQLVYQFADLHKLRVVDRGDRCGLAMPRQPADPKLPILKLNVSSRVLQ